MKLAKPLLLALCVSTLAAGCGGDNEPTQPTEQPAQTAPEKQQPQTFVSCLREAGVNAERRGGRLVRVEREAKFANIQRHPSPVAARRFVAQLFPKLRATAERHGRYVVIYYGEDTRIVTAVRTCAGHLAP